MPSRIASARTAGFRLETGSDGTVERKEGRIDAAVWLLIITGRIRCREGRGQPTEREKRSPNFKKEKSQ